MSDDWQKTICILCSVNCGLEVKLDGRHITRVRGNGARRVTRIRMREGAAHRLLPERKGSARFADAPARRRQLRENRLGYRDRRGRRAAVRVRDQFGGASIFYYGGGGQGNHLCGAYSTATRRALGAVCLQRARAGKDRRVLGRTTALGSVLSRFRACEVAIFVGKNPWQSHGFQSARPTLRKISVDPNRTLIVIDPRRTETAELADYHLRVRPGTDAFCLSAILAAMVQEDLIAHDYFRERMQGSAELFEVLREVPVADYCARAGLDEVWFARWRGESRARRASRSSKISASKSRCIARSTRTWRNYCSP